MTDKKTAARDQFRKLIIDRPEGEVTVDSNQVYIQDTSNDNDRRMAVGMYLAASSAPPALRDWAHGKLGEDEPVLIGAELFPHLKLTWGMYEGSRLTGKMEVSFKNNGDVVLYIRSFLKADADARKTATRTKICLPY